MARLETNQETILKEPIYPPHPGVPAPGRSIVFVPEDYDFTEGDEGGMTLSRPFDRSYGKYGIIVKVGADLPLLPKSEWLVEGVICKIPDNPGTKEMIDGNIFYNFPYYDIQVLYPDYPRGVCIYPKDSMTALSIHLSK
jgi:hypothetical protein